MRFSNKNSSIGIENFRKLVCNKDRWVINEPECGGDICFGKDDGAK